MPIGKPKEPKAPKAPKEKKVKPPKEKKPKKPRPPKGKKGKKGQELPPEELEGQEEGEQPKKKKPIILLLIPVVVIAAAAAVFFFIIRPKFFGDQDPDVSASVEPEPPVLPTEIPIGDDVSIKGLVLEADESGALAEKAKTITYIYSNLNDAGKAAQTYVSQLATETPAFSVVDEEFVRLTEKPDYTTPEGMVLLARNVPVEAPEATPTPEAAPTEEVSSDPEASAEPTPTPTPEPEPEPTEEPVTYVHTVRITWSPGVCVVTADEEEGKVTSPPPSAAQRPNQSISIWDAEERLEAMNPAQLGLTGASMDEYEVIPMDGTQLVDGNACICMYVYSNDNAAHSNMYMGSYLMSLDGEHLYRLDPNTNEVTELEYSPD